MLENEKPEERKEIPSLSLKDRLALLKGAEDSFRGGREALAGITTSMRASDFDSEKNSLNPDELIFLYDLRNKAIQYLVSEVGQALAEAENNRYSKEGGEFLMKARECFIYFDEMEKHHLLDNKETNMLRIKRIEYDRIKEITR